MSAARQPHYHGWPRQMRAETAAAYVDEKSVDAFLAACAKAGEDLTDRPGPAPNCRAKEKLYPAPRMIMGKGHRWLIEDLDAALDKIHGRRATGSLSDLV